MTLNEMDNFYKNDLYLYNLIYNKEFIDLYNKMYIKNIYNIFEIQELINNLIIYSDNIKDVLFNIEPKLKLLLEGAYLEGTFVDPKNDYITIGLFINNSWDRKVIYPIYVDRFSGMVDKSGLEKIGISKNYRINEFLEIVKNKKIVSDYSDVLDTISKHKEVLYFRDYILKLASIGILYKYTYDLEKNYNDAKEFINKVNDIFNTNIDSSYLDVIINKDYSVYSNELNRVVYYKDNKKRLFRK